MSYSFSDQPPVKMERPASENTLGLIGFIISLMGLFVCFAAPIGLVLSVVGLRREPRGFAIAGTIVGGMMSFFYGLIVLVYSAAIVACIGIGAVAAPTLQTIVSLQEAGRQIENAKSADGVYPDQEAGNQLIGGMTDHWQSGLRYEPTSDGFVIRSAGPDKQFNTSDDLTINDREASRLDDHSNEPLPQQARENEVMEKEERELEATN